VWKRQHMVAGTLIKAVTVFNNQIGKLGPARLQRLLQPVLALVAQALVCCSVEISNSSLFAADQQAIAWFQQEIGLQAVFARRVNLTVSSKRVQHADLNQYLQR